MKPICNKLLLAAGFVAVLYLIPAIAGYEYFEKGRQMPYLKLVSRAYAYWGMTFAINF